MTDETPFLAVGNDELGAEVKKGDIVVSNSGYIGTLKYGVNLNTGKETPSLGYIHTDDGDALIVSVAGKLLNGWRKQDDNTN